MPVSSLLAERFPAKRTPAHAQKKHHNIRGPAPFDRTRDIACPVIGFFGRDDTNPSPADVDRIDAELTRHGKPHEFHRYDGAGHAFLNFANAERYRPDQAKDAWAKMLDFLDRYLKGRSAR